MATRATQGFYQSVYANILPLVSLAQNSVQYITQLREVQDDYSLLDASGEQDGLKIERYRQRCICWNHDPQRPLLAVFIHDGPANSSSERAGGSI